MSWSSQDLLFLRKLRITADDYPAPLPRFGLDYTERGDVGMFDRRTRRLWLFLPEHFADPTASATDVIDQMNAYEDEQRAAERGES